MSDSGYVEIIYIDSNEDARKTGMGAVGATWEETRRCFNVACSQQCDIESAEFLCDLHDTDGDIIETVGLTRSAVEWITGETAKSDDEYVAYDKNFWSTVQRERAA